MLINFCTITTTYAHTSVTLGVALTDKSPEHELVPAHKLISKDEGEKILAEFKVGRNQIPKIRLKDAGLAGLGAKPGSIVKVTRLDGSEYYRLVVDQ